MILGCIADDFTGASDAASFLVAGGMKTLLVNGVPTGNIPADADAVVVALKSRTQEKTAAVADSVKALRYLAAQGARHFYVKYCSTFDSTPAGNIGPICDAALELLAVPYTLLCPSLPVNGRTVRKGILYVNGVPLAESHMKNHPLTPMRESDLLKLMAPQSKYQTALWEAGTPLEKLDDSPEVRYYVPNYETEADAERIIASCGDCKLLTGGSGLLTAWSRYLGANKEIGVRLPPSQKGSILLAGSCSQMTLAQISHFQKQGGLSYKLNPEKLLRGEQTMADVEAFIREADGQNVLIYSSETPAYLEAVRGELLEKYAAKIEATLAQTALLAQKMGIGHIIVAGGETSGAVTKALNYPAYWIGPSVAPGVPVMMPADNPALRLVLKSGNFGQEDFFTEAIKLAEGGK